MNIASAIVSPCVPLGVPAQAKGCSLYEFDRRDRHPIAALNATART